MKKIFSFNEDRSGTLIDSVSKNVCTTTGTFVRAEKGYALKLEPAQTLTFASSIANARRMVVWSKGGLLLFTINYAHTVGGTALNQYLQWINYQTGTLTFTNNTSFPIYLFYAAVFNEDLTTEELNELTKRFLNASTITYPTGDADLPKPTDLSSEEGLVAAYIPSIKTVVGGQLLDISGNGKHGTINGAKLTKDGMKFTVPNTVTFTSTAIGTNDFTYCGRIYPTANDICPIGGLNIFCFFFKTTSLRIFKGGSGQVLEFSKASNINTWYNIVYSRVSGVGYLYVDGILIGSGTDSTNYNGTNYTLGVFAPWELKHFQGTYNDFRIYNYAFTPSQAVAYHNSFIKPVLIEDFRNYPVTAQ